MKTKENLQMNSTSFLISKVENIIPTIHITIGPEVMKTEVN